MTENGRLFILSGPAGAGKGTLRKILFQAIPELVFSVSCTTRKQRAYEIEGKDYYFTSRECFSALAAKNAFLECAEVHGNYYATRQADVDECIAAGRDMILEIDVQGSRQVSLKMPSAIKIFITVPSLDDLMERLKARGTETQEQLFLRFRNAESELACMGEYDHRIVNDDVKRASQELIDLVESYRKH